MNSEANLIVNASILCEELAALTANYNDCVPTKPVSSHKGPVLEIFKKLRNLIDKIYHRYFMKEMLYEDLAQAGHSFKLSKLSITVCRSSGNFTKDVSIVS